MDNLNSLNLTVKEANIVINQIKHEITTGECCLEAIPIRLNYLLKQLAPEITKYVVPSKELIAKKELIFLLNLKDNITFCPNCQSSLFLTDKFCYKCGAKNMQSIAIKAPKDDDLNLNEIYCAKLYEKYPLNFKYAYVCFLRYVNDKTFHFFKYDVMQPLVCNVDFQYIIHAASGACPAEFGKYPVEVMKGNINGVDNLMSYGIQHGMKRLLYISSGEVYGEGDGRVFTEEYSGYVDCASPRSCYPSSKRAAETLCISYSVEYNVDVVIARPCHVYGPEFTESDNRVYAQFIRNVLQGEDVVMKSTGEQFRSWCYVVDCVSGLLHVLLKGENREVYNIADEDSNITIRQLAELIAGLVGRKVIMKCPDDFEKKGYNMVSKSVFATKKLEALGWNIEGCMRDKMLKTIMKVNL